MPRYFFDVYDGRSMADDEGTDLPNIEAAKLAAFHLAGGLLKDLQETPKVGTWRLQVRSEGGAVFTIDLSARE